MASQSEAESRSHLLRGNASSATDAKSQPYDGSRQHTETSALSADPTSSARPSANRSLSQKLIRGRSSNNYGMPGGGSNSAAESRADVAPMDPLSRHIFERAQSSTRPAAAPESNALGLSESPPKSKPPTRVSSDQPTASASTVPSQPKHAKNKSSFLSRFIGGKKPGLPVAVDRPDSEDDPGDSRTEGMHAETFARPIGYTPKYLEPPKYIKVKARAKKERDFDKVFLAQELRGLTSLEVAQEGGRRINPAEKPKRGEAIWCMAFSLDGSYLAAGGQDHIVRVWKVIATKEDREEHENEEDCHSKDEQGTRLSAPVFRTKPIHEYQGHTESVLDISWSKNHFLLSTGMDRVCRLWNITRSECLCAFKHSDIVTSVQFHPLDDRFFLAGSLDKKLRLWSIPDKSIAFATTAGDLITSAAFSPDGKTAIAGCLSGLCEFYATDRLQLQTQMHVRSARGKNSKGAKITGICTTTIPPNDPSGEVKLLVTSNDSRVRVYNFRDKSLELKLKGHENVSSQIRATFSDDGRFIVTGSEDSRVHIWSHTTAERDKDKHPTEVFEAHTSTVTAAVMAPARTKELLQCSADPIFTLCNPPPVQLQSLTESQQSTQRPDTGTPDEPPPTPTRPKVEESPAFVARSSHRGGNIIVTADVEGHIKVFRQDCGFRQRLRYNDSSWETGSAFSRRGLPRSPSIVTRGSRRSVQEGGPSDRILAWRQSIDAQSRFSLNSSTNASFEAFATPRSTRHGFSRSSSPPKSLAKPAAAAAAPPPSIHVPTPAGTPTVMSTPAPPSPSRPPPRGSVAGAGHASATTPAEPSKLRPDGARPAAAAAGGAASLLAPSAGAVGGAALVAADSSGSQAYYDRAAYESQANPILRMRTIDINGLELGPAAAAAAAASGSSRTASRDPSRGASIDVGAGDVRWSSDSAEGGAGSGAPARDRRNGVRRFGVSSDDEGDESSDERVRCRRCGGEDFKARKKAGRPVLVCGRCGEAVDE